MQECENFESRILNPGIPTLWVALNSLTTLTTPHPVRLL